MVLSRPGYAVLPLLILVTLLITATSFSVSSAARISPVLPNIPKNNYTVKEVKDKTCPAELSRWDSLIKYNAKLFALDTNLISAIIWIESAGNPQAYSSSGAVGLMQVMPRDGIAAGFLCGDNPCFINRPLTSELWPPEVNIEFGCKLLSEYIEQYGSIREALKHYGPLDVGYSYANQVIALAEEFSRE